MTTLKPGDQVMVVKDMLNTESHNVYMLKTATVEHTEVEDEEGFIVRLKEFSEYRFHPDELQLIQDA